MNEEEIAIKKMTDYTRRIREDFFWYEIYNKNRISSNGIRLWNYIQTYIDRMLPKVLDYELLYRAREVEVPDIKSENGFKVENHRVVSGFDSEQSGRPPEKLSRPGRLNTQWESIWYFANDKYTALSEIRIPTRNYASLAEYRVNNADVPIRVLDFSSDVSNLTDVDSLFTEESGMTEFANKDIHLIIQQLLTLPYYNESTYYNSNKLSGMIKKREDVDGVIYKSFFGTGNNIALWKESCDEKLSFDRSQVYMLYCTNQAFFNLDDESMIDNEQSFTHDKTENYRFGLKEANTTIEKILRRNPQ